jgi:signal transduction histidine kinase
VSVLHNIGNAITPMVIRLQNYRNQHQKNQIAEYLQMLQNLLITQLEQGNLERFLKEDPRGQQIPQFMEQLTQQQKQGNEVLSEMLNNLDHQFRHITEIIALQQKYAHMQGVEETYPLASVVEDSLGMMQPSLEKRNVVGKLVESSGTALVHNDPNKMAQLFLNLFKNSVEALDARLSKEPKFRGTIEIRIREEEGVVYVEVQDNGQGVAPETLPHAFEFGFSTKNRGSGFGLHDCANFIRAQGGEIRLESEGLGQGAKVSLSLPSASAGGKVSNSVTTLDPA